MINFLSLCLLRRHVRHRPERRPGLRHPRHPRQLRQPKIDNLHLTIVRNHDIRWLDVTVNNPLSMRFHQPLANLNRNINGLFDRQRSTSDLLLQRLPFVVIHADEQQTIVCLINVMDGTDVVVLESRRSLRFVDEALF